MSAWFSGVEGILKRQGPPPMGMDFPPEYVAFTNAPRILAISGTFFTLSLVIVLLRSYVRIAMLKVFGPDDYVMVFATIISAATFTCFKLETDQGLGKHLPVVMSNPVAYTNFQRLLYVHSILVMVGLSTVKISIALFLVRLSTQAKYRRSLYGIMVFLVLMTFVCAMTLILQCIPVRAAWDIRLRPPPLGRGSAKCYSLNIFRNLGLMNSVFNIVTDVLFATIPIPLIWALQLDMKKRISLIMVLSLGWFGCVAGIIKAVQQWHVLFDLDWTVNDGFHLWNYIEFTIGIIAASLPSLKPLFNWFYDSARAFTTGRSGGGTVYPGGGYKNAGSLGYHKQTDATESLALQSIKGKRESMRRSPYDVHVTSGPTGKVDKEAWDIVHAVNSNESVLPLQDQNGIMMTREVRVS